MRHGGLHDPTGLRRAVIALLAAAVVWAPGATLGLAVPWHHDLRTHHYPWRAWGAAEWASGHLPLWCAGAGCGHPLLADGQAGLLYPPTMLLFALLPDPLALGWTLLLHAAWAGVGTVLLARALGRSEAAALLAGAAFAFGGFLATHAHYLGMQAVIAWVPFTLWAVVRATDAAASGHARGRAWGFTALGLWMILVAGHVQVAVFGWMLAGIVTLWRLPWGMPRQAWRPLAGFAVAALLAAALSAPQLAATAELARLSFREGGVDAAFAGIGSLPPQELVHAVLPRFFGFDRPADVLRTYTHRGTGYWGVGESHWEMSFYLGIPVAILAAWGIRGQRFWTAVGVAGLVLMLGSFTPVWGLVRHLPGLDRFRFPVRFALWVSLAAALLAAAGLDGVLADLRDRPGVLARRARRLLLVIAAGVVLLAGLRLGLALGEEGVRDALTRRFEAEAALPAPPVALPPLVRAAPAAPGPEDPAAIPAKVDRIVASLAADTTPWSPLVLWPGGVAVLLAAGLLAASRRRIGPATLAYGATALLVADLYLFGGTYQPPVPRESITTPPAALAAIEGDPGTFRVTVLDRRGDADLDRERMSASLGLLWGLQDVVITSPLMLPRTEALLATCGLDAGLSEGEPRIRAFLDHLPIADLLGVRYLLTTHLLDDSRLEPLRTAPVRLYRNHGARPLATLVGCAYPADGPEAALAALATLDPTREAVVEAEAAALPADLWACAGDPAGTATLRSKRDDAWRIRTTTTRPALLVIAQSLYPGWHATLDGMPTPLLPADLAFGALPVPAGTHEVELDYRPAWLRPALGLAAAAFAGLLGLLLLPGGRRRRDPVLRTPITRP